MRIKEAEKNIVNTAGIFILLAFLIISCLYLIIVTEPQYYCNQKQISEIEAKALTCDEKDVEKCYSKLIEVTCPLRKSR